ncbi:MAG: hypothetical protein ACK41Q_00260 [Candidatus Brocadia sp.]
MPVKNDLLTGWLIEAVLISSGKKSASLKTIINSPALFPLSIALSNSKILGKSDRLDIFRHGLDEEMVVLRSKRDMRCNMPSKAIQEG